MLHSEFSWPAKDGINLFGQQWAPEGDFKAILCLVHGIGEHTGRYGFVAEQLVANGYVLFGYDQRGHGRSAGQRGHSPSLEITLDDIGLLLQQAGQHYPGKRIFLYGHSLGGGLVLNYALRRHPKIAGIIATSPSLRQTISPPGWKLLLGRVMYLLLPTFGMSSGLDVKAISRDPQVVEAYIEDPLVHDKVSARFGIDGIDSGRWALEHAAELDLPLLLMHGSADRITSPDASREFAANSPRFTTLHILEGCYHELHNEPEKETVLRLMVNWLDGQTLPAPDHAAAAQRVHPSLVAIGG